LGRRERSERPELKFGWLDDRFTAKHCMCRAWAVLSDMPDIIRAAGGLSRAVLEKRRNYFKRSRDSCQQRHRLGLLIRREKTMIRRRNCAAAP